MHDVEENRRTTAFQKRPITAKMNNILSIEAELSFTVRLFTGKNPHKEE